MAGFYREDGCLTVDGLRLDDIAGEFGTPLYVYSAAAVESAYERFSGAVDGVDSQVHFALKANSNMAILRLLARLGAGADIVSGGEMRRALDAGIPPDKIIFSGVGKTDPEIRAALDSNIGQINAESPAEVERILAIAEEVGQTVRIALRVNPDVESETHTKLATGKRDTKFGIAMGDCAGLYRQISDHPRAVAAGLAVHIGSQIMSLEPFESAWTNLLDLAQTLQDDGMEVPSFDLGGGLGVDYKTGEGADLDGFGQLVTRLFGNRKISLGFEPGRFIVAEAGALITRVIYTKDNTDKTFVITDAAMNDLLRPTLYEAYHRIEPVSRPPEEEEEVMSDIVGPVCEPGDFLGLGRMMPKLEKDDLLAVMSAGAYSAVMRSSYNTRPPAAEVLVIDGEAHRVSKQQSVQDLIDLDIIPKALR
jgi:diaminopimelate decarboxylase